MGVRVPERLALAVPERLVQQVPAFVGQPEALLDGRAEVRELAREVIERGLDLAAERPAVCVKNR